MIIATSAIRLYHENKHFNLQGKIGGFVLQLIAGIGKLRVAAATARALAVWSRQFATQKQYFIASQRAANVLGVFETAFPTIATLIIFAAATFSKSKLLLDVGGFLRLLHRIRTIDGIDRRAGRRASSESLIAIPHLTRLRPLISGAAELSDDRKPPGELSGAVEFSRVTFRYAASGPPVLDNVSLRIAQGEYVAIVGPSGSGKSSLFRLLLGFEKPESGAVFLDGKAHRHARHQRGAAPARRRAAERQTGDGQHLRQYLRRRPAAARTGLGGGAARRPRCRHQGDADGHAHGGRRRRQHAVGRPAPAHHDRPRGRAPPAYPAVRRGDERARQPVAGDRQRLARQPQRDADRHRAPALSTVRQADRIIVLVDGKVVQTGSYAELSSTPGMFASFAQRQLL